MAAFSTNQNKLMFVISSKIEGNSYLAPGDFSLTANNEEFYLTVMGHGGPVRTDIIKYNNVVSVVGSDPANYKLKSYKVTVNDNPIKGQDYVLRVNFRQAFGMSDEDFYIKDAAVRVTSSINTKSLFYQNLAASLVRNFKRLYQPLIEISASGTYDVSKIAVRVDSSNNVYNAAGEKITFNDGIYLNEASQVSQWQLGVAQYTPVYFEVIPTTIVKEGEEVIWGTVTDNTSTYAKTVVNGYQTADLEYFCMGERADQYRNVGWPNVIPTKYMVDPTKEYGYLNITYNYQGSGEDNQKSRKELILVSEKSTVKTILGTVVATIADNVNVVNPSTWT